MIPVGLFHYEDGRTLDFEITRYVNDNLVEILRVLRDRLQGDPDFGMDEFLPWYYIEEHSDNEARVRELYDIVSQNDLRKWISPVYEYMLYSILEWWEDMWDDESDLFPVPLSDELVSKIHNETRYIDDDGNHVLSAITNYAKFKDIWFEDNDFLPTPLAKYVDMYLTYGETDFDMCSSEYLDNYIDLMPVDLRNQYLEKKNPSHETKYSDGDIERGIVDELYRALLDLQKRAVEVYNRGETEISSDICGIVARILNEKYKLNITRETPMGYALKKIGETDLFIYSADMSRYYAVCENKLIEDFDDALGQLWGYLNFHFQFGVTISINKKFTLPDARKHIEDKLLANAYPAFSLVDLRDTGLPYVLKSMHKIPEDDDMEFPIYHLILHLKEDERREAARQAR